MFITPTLQEIHRTWNAWGCVANRRVFTHEELIPRQSERCFNMYHREYNPELRAEMRVIGRTNPVVLIDRGILVSIVGGDIRERYEAALSLSRLAVKLTDATLGEREATMELVLFYLLPQPEAVQLATLSQTYEINLSVTPEGLRRALDMYTLDDPQRIYE